jgi:hypothetical protein
MIPGNSERVAASRARVQRVIDDLSTARPAVTEFLEAA